MGSMAYGSGPGGYSLQTDVGSVRQAPGAAPGGDMMEFFRQLAARAQAQKAQPAQAPSLGVAAPQAATITRSENYNDPNAGLRQQAEAAALNTQLIRNQKMTQPGGGPKYFLQGANINGGWMPDTAKYDAIDRELYLPQNSQSQGHMAPAGAIGASPSNVGAPGSIIEGGAGAGYGAPVSAPQGTAPMLTPANAATGATAPQLTPSSNAAAQPMDPYAAAQHRIMNQYGERDPNSPALRSRPRNQSLPPGW